MRAFTAMPGAALAGASRGLRAEFVPIVGKTKGKADMGRYAVRAGVALAAVVVLWGCGLRGPMTDSEFMGFCSATNARHGGCDSLGLCDEYLAAVGKPQPDLQACLSGCEDVRAKLSARNRQGRCQATVKAGADWCQRYCRTLYPQ